MEINEYELFKAVLEQIPEGIIIVDSNDVIVYINKAAEEIRHVSAEELLGRNVTLCHPEKSTDRVKRALQFLRTKEKKAFNRMVVDLHKCKYYENTYTALTDADKNYIGSIVVSRDITKKRKLEEERATYLQNLEEKVEELTAKLQDLFVSSMVSLINTLEAKDPYTKGHSLRVCDMAVQMVEHKYGVSSLSKEIEIAGKLHDIGKVGIRESVLRKPGKLNDDEYNHIKEHPIIAERIIMPYLNLKSVAKIIRHHHERYDGKGYPNGLSKNDIPLGSRILAIADSYDAMTSDRPYRCKMDPIFSADEIKKNLETQFDPEWGEIFLELFYSGSIG